MNEAFTETDANNARKAESCLPNPKQRPPLPRVSRVKAKSKLSKSKSCAGCDSPEQDKAFVFGCASLISQKNSCLYAKLEIPLVCRENSKILLSTLRIPRFYSFTARHTRRHGHFHRIARQGGLPRIRTCTQPSQGYAMEGTASEADGTDHDGGSQLLQLFDAHCHFQLSPSQEPVDRLMSRLKVCYHSLCRIELPGMYTAFSKHLLMCDEDLNTRDKNLNYIHSIFLIL